RHIPVFRVEPPIDLRPAGVHQPREPALAEPALAHRFGELPRDHFLNRFRLHLGEHAFLIEKAVERRTPVSVVSHSPPLSCGRQRASGLRAAFSATSSRTRAARRARRRGSRSKPARSSCPVGRYEPQTDLFPSAGPAACQRAIDIEPAANACRWPADRPPPVHPASPV